MRTLRKVFCILILAVLVTSSAAMAAPVDRSDDGRSIGAWTLSVLDSIIEFLQPEDSGENLKPDQFPQASQRGEASTSDGIDNLSAPGGSPLGLDDGGNPPGDEAIGGIEPGG